MSDASMHHDGRCVIVFVRAPEPGRVKTRLARVLGDKIARELYVRFTVDVLETLQEGQFPVRICFHPPEAADPISRWLGMGYRYFPQRGEDLGERMANAFRNVFSDGIQRALLIGTDFPDLPARIVELGFQALAGHDAVIGPATDGGYYLVGFSAETLLEDIFRNMPWGSGTVFSRTLAVFEEKGAQVRVLPPWRDIDVVDDLADFLWTGGPAGSGPRHTLSYISSLPTGILSRIRR